MNLLRKLFIVEWLKIRHRSIFAIALLGHASIVAMGLALQQYMHARNPRADRFALPADWDTLMSNASSIGMLMLLICVASVTATETTWRTQRQNVIDGLSRAQYFGAKVLVAVMLALVFWLLTILIGVVAAAFGGEGALSLRMPEPVPLILLNGLVYLVAIGLTAFMFGMLASGSGAAVMLILAFLLVQPILGAYMMSQRGTMAKLAQYLPIEVFGNLVNPMFYDEVRRANTIEMMKKAGMDPPIDLGLSVILTICYALAFVGVTWLAFRERDL